VREGSAALGAAASLHHGHDAESDGDESDVAGQAAGGARGPADESSGFDLAEVEIGQIQRRERRHEGRVAVGDGGLTG
jgi:hypothetical protein